MRKKILDRFITYLIFEKRNEQAANNLLNDFEMTTIFYHIGILCCIELRMTLFS